VDDEREARVRALWWSSIRDLDAGEARAALLQAMLDIGEHWAKEHPEDGLPEDLGIPPDEYLTTLLRRVREDPPEESRRS
jgi:hypothetical protein